MTTETDQRIMLAVAMGWEELDHTHDRWFNDDGPQEECRDTKHLPNPFTDANNDFAVLQWMREREDSDPCGGRHIGSLWIITYDPQL